MTSKGSKTRIRWEGRSQSEVRSWPDDVKQDIGAELQRLDNKEEPLDSEPMGKSAPGISELRNEHFGVWYRLLYALQFGWVFVLHCFKKTTNQTSDHDLDLARKRLSLINEREKKARSKEKKSA